MTIAIIIKLRGKIVHNNSIKTVGQSKEKEGQQEILNQIGTVPLKAGQLEY